MYFENVPMSLPDNTNIVKRSKLLKRNLFKRGSLFTASLMLCAALFIQPGNVQATQCSDSSGESTTISGKELHTVGLKEDGTVVAVGWDRYGQLNVSDWAGIKAVSGGAYYTTGLKEDGTVVAVGSNAQGQLNVSDWTGIKAISAGFHHIVGLKDDGTVLAVGWNAYGQTNVSDWTGIKAVSGGNWHTAGLREDGTVVAVGLNTYGQTNVSDWTGIKGVSAGSYHTVGLKENGTVVATGFNRYGQLNVSDWTGIVAVSTGWWYTVGLKEDGTVVAVGQNNVGQLNVSDWTGIKAISAGTNHTVGLKEDGTMVAVGYNAYGQTDVTGWSGIRVPSCDFDDDGIDDSVDNCPLVWNPSDPPGTPQTDDRDGDGIGDPCDGDFDGDGVSDVQDNCPAEANEFQDDYDSDDIGDACDACFDDATNACLNAPPLTILEATSYPVTVHNGAATASVTVEPGNLKGDTTIQITGETGSSNFAYGSGQQVLGAVYTFTATPAGNPTFNSPGVIITLSYEQGRMPEGGMTEQRLDIYWYNTGTQQWEAQPILERNMIDNTLSIQTTHFSSYAVIAIENPVGDLLDALKDVAAGNQGIKSSFVEKVQYANDLYEAGDSTGARNTLKALINQLKALSGKKIDAADADMLIEFAEEVKAKL